MSSSSFSFRRHGAHAITAGLLLSLLPFGSALAEDWSERVEIHGFFNSTARFTSPQFDLGDAIQLTAWQQALNIEATMDVYSSDRFSVGAVAILRPQYDLVYELYPQVYGKRARSGKPGTELGLFGFTRNPDGFYHGDAVAGAGAGIDGAFRYINQDIASIFSGKNAPGIVIDDVVFFGQTVAPATPRSSNQIEIGGKPSLNGLFRNAAALSPSLQGSVAAAGGPLNEALRSPFQIFQGAPALGDRSSLEQAPFDLNRTEGQLKTACFDNSNPWCFIRELYFDVELGRTFMRLGRQQIVWGKTDAFRMQDIINPLDVGTANIFLPLEERRIPQLALDVVHSFGDVGPVQDLSLEFVWVLDRFTPNQVGQCGEPRAFLAACGARSNAGAHGLLGLALAEVEERDWQLRNTEPGFRFEGRFADPDVSWSFSAFWGIQDIPVLKLANSYSFANPNPGAILFLQGLTVPEQLTAGGILPPGATSFQNGFNPYDPAAILQAAAEIRGVYAGLFGPGGALCDAALATSAEAHAACIGASGLQNLALPFSGGEVILEYPRTLTLGASLDYQIPGADTILNLEMAYDVKRKLISTAQPDLIGESGVISAAVGMDWSPFIPLLNKHRTALVSSQLFVEHILDYDDDGQGRRMVQDETQVLSTLIMQNYWRNDSVILTNFLAYDWNAQAAAWGPSLKWILNESMFVEFGAQMIWSKKQKAPLRNTCGGDITVACISDPAAFQPGNFQSINLGFARTSETPIVPQSFGDHFEEDRDSIFMSFTYQF